MIWEQIYIGVALVLCCLGGVVVWARRPQPEPDLLEAPLQASPPDEEELRDLDSQSPTLVNMERTRIFINYRRADTLEESEKLFRALCQRYGNIAFRDEGSISPGDRWIKRIESALESAEVVLALIGPDWLKHINQDRPLDQIDWLSRELEYSIRKGKFIIPIYINELDCFTPEKLPPSLRDLSYRQASWISFDSNLVFSEDFELLTKAIELKTTIQPIEDRSLSPSTPLISKPLTVGNGHILHRTTIVSRLICVTSESAGEEHILNGTFYRIGRDQKLNDIVVWSKYASSAHAEIMLEQDAYHIDDLNSRNGTLVNGSLVRTKTALHTGDVIQIGRVYYHYVAAGDIFEPTDEDIINIHSTGRKMQLESDQAH